MCYNKKQVVWFGSDERLRLRFGVERNKRLALVLQPLPSLVLLPESLVQTLIAYTLLSWISNMIKYTTLSA